MAIKNHYRVCNLCEAMCGLEIAYEGEKIISVKGDEKDPFSKGSICPKGAHIQELHESPDRLKTPVKKNKEGGWDPISWEEAFDEVGQRINNIRKAHGENAVGLYFGNPTVHNMGILFYTNELKRILGTHNVFTPTSMDQLPHHVMAYYLFGHSLRIPIPDIDHTDFMILIGANPAASNGSIMSAAGVTQRLKAIKNRGGKVITLDPRKTETSRLASEHLFIRPGADIYFLIGFLKVLITHEKINPGRLQPFLKGQDTILNLVENADTTQIASLTGISSSVLERLALEYADTPKAVLYGRMGMSTQEHGGLCHWLMQSINILSGHFDRPGTTLFPNPAVPLIKEKHFKKKHGRWHSRVSQKPEFQGEFPVSVMAEELQTPGKSKIRALITHAGNPVLATPNGKELEKGLKELDFMVSIDIFINETSAHADIILPPASHLEVPHYDLIFNLFAVHNTAKFSKPLFPISKEQRYDWQIAKALLLRFEKASPKKLPWMLKRLSPERLLNLGLQLGPYGRLSHPKRWFTGLTLGKLKRNPHGIALGSLQSQIPEVLLTKSGKIELDHEVFVKPFTQLLEALPEKRVEKVKENEFLLIGRRHLRSNNSWMHNSPSLMTGKNRCTVMLHPDDAARLNILKNETVLVQSRTGQLQIAAEITPNIMPGVVSIPHGFGHHRKGTRLQVASKHAGVSLNDITDNSRMDPVTGNAAFSGQPVTLIKQTT